MQRRQTIRLITREDTSIAGRRTVLIRDETAAIADQA